MQFALRQLPVELHAPIFDWVGLEFRNELLQVSSYSRRHILSSPFPKIVRRLIIEVRWEYLYNEPHLRSYIMAEESDWKTIIETDTDSYQASGWGWYHLSLCIRSCESLHLIDLTSTSPQPHPCPQHQWHLSIGGYFAESKIKHLRRIHLDCHVADLLPDLVPFQLESVQEITVSLKQTELDDDQQQHLELFLQDPVVRRCRERLSIHANLPRIGNLIMANWRALRAHDLCHTIIGGWTEMGATFRSMIREKMAPTLYPRTKITLSMLSQSPSSWMLACEEFDRFASLILENTNQYQLQEAVEDLDGLLALVDCAFSRFEAHHRIKIFQAQAARDELYVIEMFYRKTKDQPNRVDIRFVSGHEALCRLLNQQLQVLNMRRKGQGKANVEFWPTTEKMTGKRRLYLQAFNC